MSSMGNIQKFLEKAMPDQKMFVEGNVLIYKQPVIVLYTVIHYFGFERSLS